VNGRVERLRELLEEPLLVTNPTNLFYLTGFKTSNGALLIEPERVRLFSDFRYAEAARAVEGVEFEETKRALLKDLAERLSGRIGFEADFVSYAGYETLRAGSIEPVPRRGVVEGLRAVKDEGELASIKRACEIADRVYERLAGERFVGRTERDVAWTIEQLVHDEGGETVAFETIVASGPNAARPHARASDRMGLDVHEAPRLSTESGDTLEAGNVVTVEPGIYVEGRIGIRIEDNVVITEDGIENYTGFRKDLITVD
jgi:Xaa-Pro aminopeptidase